MHKVSRSLLLAGVLAFGGLTAACDNGTTTVVAPTPVSVTLTPPSATIPVGTSIQLAVSVTADANTAKTVTYTSSAAGVASVDATGKVTGVSAGTATIIATSTADPSKAAASVITVTGAVIPVQPTIAINSVTNTAGVPVTLSNVSGQINVTVNTSGGGLIEVFLSSNCTTNSIGATDVAVASQQATSAQPGTVTLSFNTAQLTTATPPAPRFVNGNYCVKARLTNGTQVVVATNTVPLTLNNPNAFTGTLAFASQTGGPTTAVSSLNGLNYNQGTLTATLNPVIFTGSSPAVFISGYLTRNGEQGGGASPGNAAFTNAAVASGVATIVFTDTASFPSFAGVNSISQYTSLPAGDTLYITSATDASGNPITVGTSGIAVTGASGVRIDNDVPSTVGATYVVTAPNGYVGGAYAFASGIGGTPAADTRGGVQGVGGVTSTFYIGAAGAPAFAGAAGTKAACDITGLTAAATAAQLNNSFSTSANQAKVIVRDALGNLYCQNVASSFAGGLFGVDKIAPSVTMTTANNGAADVTGYNATKNFSFIYNDTISGFNPTTPLRGTLTRNFFTNGTGAAADCVIGTYSATPKTCAAAPITVTSNFGTPPAAGGSIEFTGATAVVGYYTVNAVAVDQALNVSTSVQRTAAFDNVAPTVSAATQAAPVVPLGTVTVSATAADNFDLASSKGRLTYATALPFASVAGTSFGPNFDATLVTSGTATVALPNVYRGLQSVTAGDVIQANSAAPTATITVTDVGTNTATSAALPITTTTAATNVLVAGNTFAATPTSTAPTTSQTSTTLTVRVGGLVSDPAFQSQPFAQIDIYKVVGGELVLVGTNTLASVTDVGTARTYTYTSAGVALTAAATNTFYVVGRTAAGDAVISNAITVTNP